MHDSEFPGKPEAGGKASRPLLGLTILVVEDSRYCCDALRLMCTRSGARIRRAHCLASARRHLEVYRPSAVIVDMGLPDGSGADLLAQLRANRPRVSVILATSGDAFAEHCAIAAGADGFLPKPLCSIAQFQSAILSHLPSDGYCASPRAVSASDDVRADPVAYRDDMSHAAEILECSEDLRDIDYAARFLSGVALSAGDRVLAEAANALFEARMSNLPIQACLARLSGLVHERLDDRIAI